MYFKKEHNSAWYYFDIEKDGYLGFEIIPLSEADDYDFMLFKYTDQLFCNNLKYNKIKPIRSNIARTGKNVKSITGLSGNAPDLYVGQGIGNPFSKSIQVKKGERYYLVLDNVYMNGKGHIIKLYYERKSEISGYVYDENNKPIADADVILEDVKGDTISRTKSDTKGFYKINTHLKIDYNYQLTIFKENYFFKTVTINEKQLKEQDYKITNIKSILPLLKEGNKYVYENINFKGNSTELYQESMPTVYYLAHLMMLNKKLKIRIEGHVNDPFNEFNEFEKQKLSEDRAKKIYEILVKLGIDKNRIETIGYGSKFMVYPNAYTEEEMKTNRRVEINVLEY
jgi:outer membrane protein OmpA-like peptidoglycan-associated protein